MSPRRRTVTFAESVTEKLATLCRDEDEVNQIAALFETLVPESGFQIFFSGYPGDHRGVEFGRFVFVYQFSASEVRVKSVDLSSKYL